MTAPGPAAPLSLDPHKFLVPLDYEAEKTTVKYAFTARCPPSARQSEEIHREIAERVASQLTSHKYLALLLRQQAAPGRGCIYAQATAELWSPVLKPTPLSMVSVPKEKLIHVNELGYGDNPHLDKCVVPLVDTYEVATQVVVVLNVFGYKRETGDFCCGSTLAFVLSEAFIDRHNSVDFKHPQVLQRWDPTGQVVVSSQTLPPGRLYLADHPEKIRTMTVQVPNDYRDNEAFWQYWSATSVSDARTCTGCFARAGDVKFKLCAQCKTVAYCSRECQVKHWADHKTFCKQQQASQSKPIVQVPGEKKANSIDEVD